MKLKSKIFNWLFKEQIEDIQGIKNECDKLLKRCIEENQNSKHSLKIANESLDKAQISYRTVLELEDRINQVFGNSIGVSADIHAQFAPSWAVVCIQGKTDFVKFINLGEQDIRTISRFLNNFDRRHVNADLPPHFRNTDFFLEIGKH